MFHFVFNFPYVFPIRIRVTTVLASLFLMVTQAASFCYLGASTKKKLEIISITPTYILLNDHSEWRLISNH